MKRFTLFTMATLAALSVGCIAKYQPAVGEKDGYLEYEISPDIYNVHYQHNPQPLIRYFGPSFDELVLLRAADLALAQGYGWFIVDETALPGISRGGRTLVVKFLAEPLDVDGVEVYDAHKIVRKIRARHRSLRSDGSD